MKLISEINNKLNNKFCDIVFLLMNITTMILGVLNAIILGVLNAINLKNIFWIIFSIICLLFVIYYVLRLIKKCKNN